MNVRVIRDTKNKIEVYQCAICEKIWHIHENAARCCRGGLKPGQIIGMSHDDAKLDPNQIAYFVKKEAKK